MTQNTLTHESQSNHSVAGDRVLFLDFDGPLFSTRAVALDPRNNENDPQVKEFVQFIHSGIMQQACTYVHADPIAINMLNALFMSVPYRIVVSSSWAQLIDKRECEKLFEINGILAPLHEYWVTPKKMSSYRVNEISWWIKQHSPSCYAILDDQNSGRTLIDGVGIDPARVVIVDEDDGIRYNDYLKLVDIMGTQIE